MGMRGIYTYLDHVTETYLPCLRGIVIGSFLADSHASAKARGERSFALD